MNNSMFLHGILSRYLLLLIGLTFFQVGCSQSPENLLEARKGFQTVLLPDSEEFSDPAEDPPKEIFSHIKYSSEVGDLSAYVTPDPGDGERHPAVLWAHGGFGGISTWFWEPADVSNDQSAAAFRKAGFVLMAPSWRGENDNPGDFELFYGEVNDLLSAYDYLSSLSYVDPERIYLAGHSTGGTMVLLGVTATDKFRAAFSFGGAPNIRRTISNGVGYGNTPFDYEDEEEGRLRSAIDFVKAIQTPTFYFEGEVSSYVAEANRMEEIANETDQPFTSCIIKKGTHFDILSPLTKYVAQQIVEDTGPECEIKITSEDANRVYFLATAEHQKERASKLASLPVVELTEAGLAAIIKISKESSLDLNAAYLGVSFTNEGWSLGFENEFNRSEHILLKQGDLKIIIPRSSVESVRGYMIDFSKDQDQAGFSFYERNVD